MMMLRLTCSSVIHSNGKPKEATVRFNSKDGTATGVFQVRQISVPAWNATTVKAKDDMFSYFYQQSHDITVTKNIGNMVYDKYFILVDIFFQFKILEIIQIP